MTALSGIRVSGNSWNDISETEQKNAREGGHRERERAILDTHDEANILRNHAPTHMQIHGG